MYSALESLYRLKSLNDLALLKEESFLKSCGLADLSLQLETHQPDQQILNSQKREAVFEKEPAPVQDQTLFEFEQALRYQNRSFGKVVFYSHKKLSKSKKSFLEKLSLSLSAALYFIEQNQRANWIGSQWREIFNSFPLAFCITNEQFQIIRCNQAFQKLFVKSKEEVFFQNLFKLFPVPVKIPKTWTKKPSSFIAKGEDDKVYWRIVCQKLYLKKEVSQSFLFLIKDISPEMEFEAKISAQSKNQEMGWMKGSLAHELNNPITGIKLLISVIEKELPETETSVQQHLKEMQKSISTCQSVIQNLLSASKTPSDI